jgi:hypothetical protein
MSETREARRSERLEAENKRLRSALGIIAHFPTDSPIKNLVDAAYYIGWLVANAREVLGEGGHMEDTNEREDMIEDEINACPGCGDRYFPRRSDCEACIAVVDERIAARRAPAAEVLLSSEFDQTVVEALRPRPQVLVIGDPSRLTPVVLFDEWPEEWNKAPEPEGPRDRHGHISSIQNGMKHNKKKGKR